MIVINLQSGNRHGVANGIKLFLEFKCFCSVNIRSYRCRCFVNHAFCLGKPKPQRFT